MITNAIVHVKHVPVNNQLHKAAIVRLFTPESFVREETLLVDTPEQIQDCKSEIEKLRAQGVEVFIP